jgi:hypothetical protein
MEHKPLKRKVTLAEPTFDENTSFGITKKGSTQGKLNNGFLAQNAGSIITDNQSGINGTIPGISNIWLSSNNDCNTDNFTVHVRGCCPKGKESIQLTFFDEAWNVHELKIYPYKEEQIHLLHYSSNYGNIVSIGWNF